MKIAQKLILGFIGVAFLVGIAGYVCLTTSQEVLQRTIGENSVILAQATLDQVDRSIYSWIERMRVYSKNLALQNNIIESNKEF